MGLDDEIEFRGKMTTPRIEKGKCFDAIKVALSPDDLRAIQGTHLVTEDNRGCKLVLQLVKVYGRLTPPQSWLVHGLCSLDLEHKGGLSGKNKAKERAAWARTAVI